jgi:hypothetical protein
MAPFAGQADNPARHSTIETRICTGATGETATRFGEISGRPMPIRSFESAVVTACRAFSLLVTVLFNFNCLAAGNLTDGPDADLIYDYRTGFVTLDPSDTPSGKIISFVVSNAVGQMFPVREEYLPLFAICSDSVSGQVGCADLTLEGRADRIQLGPIFLPGMRSRQELFDYLATAKYASQLGQGGDLDLIVVPEPSTGTLGLCGCLLGLAILGRGRRQPR